MKILVACEFSGTVRDAFISKGHDAISCDLLPTESDGPHYQGDVRDIISDDFDMMLAFPSCQHLASSGARWWKDKKELQAEALDFVRLLMGSSIPKICIENPVGKISTAIRKPDQIIQPWMFGHGELKTTCLWLKGLPKLLPTEIVEGREQRIWKMSPSKDRGKKRSVFFKGIAKAMADQWGDA